MSSAALGWIRLCHGIVRILLAEILPFAISIGSVSIATQLTNVYQPILRRRVLI